MNKKVLFVDDDQNILNAYQRAFRKKYQFETAISGSDALALLKKDPNFALVISDMRMPKMSGLELLVQLKQLYPNITRIMLTGNADQKTAIDAVNQGDIFRFLTKPSPPEDLARAIDSGLKQHSLVIAEKELLNNTLKGTVKMLAELVSLLNPTAAKRTQRLKQQVNLLAKELQIPQNWSFEVMILLSQIGYAILPKQLLTKLSEGGRLSEDEEQLYMQHPSIASNLLVNIPRLDKIAYSIAYQEKCYNGEGLPDDAIKGEDIPLGARILKLVLDFEKFQIQTMDNDSAMQRLEEHSERYDPKLLTVFKRIQPYGIQIKKRQMDLEFWQLKIGMELLQDLNTIHGQLIVGKGQTITDSVLRIVDRCLANGAISGSIRVNMNCSDHFIKPKKN